MMLDAVYSASRAVSSVNPVTLIQSQRKLLPDLEDDHLQGLPNEETDKSKILDMVPTMKSSENINKGILTNGYRVMRVKWASSI
jgi:hypothetical protein